MVSPKAGLSPLLFSVHTVYTNNVRGRRYTNIPIISIGFARWYYKCKLRRFNNTDLNKMESCAKATMIKTGHAKQTKIHLMNWEKRTRWRQMARARRAYVSRQKTQFDVASKCTRKTPGEKKKKALAHHAQCIWDKRLCSRSSVVGNSTHLCKSWEKYIFTDSSFLLPPLIGRERIWHF